MSIIYTDMAIHRKSSRPKWINGSKAIFNLCGINNFAVVEILSTETTRRKDVNVVILDYYGSIDTDKYKPGTKITAIRENLYPNLTQLFIKQTRVMFPDVLMKYTWSGILWNASRKHPEIGVTDKLVDIIEYHPYMIHGYEVIIFKDPCAEFLPFYWYLSDMEKRSVGLVKQQEAMDDEEIRNMLIDILAPAGTGRYITIEDAANAAEKYINYFIIPSNNIES